MFYSQLDPKYKSTKMGTTQRTIGDDGCTDTCLGMASGKDPNEVNRLLTAKGGYAYKTDLKTKVKYALVSWDAACKALGNLKFIWRYAKYDNQVALDAIKKYGFVLVEVDFDGNTKTTGKHWVKFDGNHVMDDPLANKGGSPISKYPLLTGMAVIQRI